MTLPTPSTTPLAWHAPSAADVAHVASHLRQGGLVVAPTESSYGLLAAANNPEAVRRLIALKGRAKGHALPLVAGSFEQVSSLIETPVSPALSWLMALWPAPLTLALPASEAALGELLAADGTVGIRIPSDLELRRLCLAVGAPLIATSANLTGEPSAYDLRALAPAIRAQTLQLDKGALPERLPSTVIAEERGADLSLKRRGALPDEHIAAIFAPTMTNQLECDALCDGALSLWQPRRNFGYRFNLDAVLLAALAQPHLSRDGRLLELGAGCGVVSLWMYAHGYCGEAVAIERQPLLAHACAKNIVGHGLVGRMRLVPGDLRDFHTTLRYNVVAFNPPYQPAHRGRPSLEPGRDAARRELHGNLEDFVRVAEQFLSDDGTVVAIVPAWRGEELIAAAVRVGLRAASLRQILARPESEPTRVVCHLRRAGCVSVERHTPLVTHAADARSLTSEVSAWVTR